MQHLNLDLTLAHQAMLRDEAAAARLVRAARTPRRRRRLPAVLALVRRSGRRVPVTT